MTRVVTDGNISLWCRAVGLAGELYNKSRHFSEKVFAHFGNLIAVIVTDKIRVQLKSKDDDESSTIISLVSFGKYPTSKVAVPWPDIIESNYVQIANIKVEKWPGYPQ